MQNLAYVFIYLEGEPKAVPAGEFRYDSVNHIGSFDYGRFYKQRKNALPVDPVTLPLVGVIQPTAKNDGIYGVFRDASPDYWGRLVIASERRASINAISDFEYLLATNASRVGNLDFRPKVDSPEPIVSVPAFATLEELMDAARAIEQERKVPAKIRALLAQGTSIGGARPKCVVERSDGLWIAKFPAKGDDFSAGRVEYAALTLAKRAGIQVPAVEVMEIGGRDVLLVSRFDRKKTKNGYTRQGFISALTLMDSDEQDITWGYPDMAARMRELGVGDKNSLCELYRRMIYNICCRNEDDHARNHGFLMVGAKLVLSPAYDILPRPAIPGVSSDFQLALRVGEGGRAATLENALTSHAQFGLAENEARHIVDEVARVTSQWAAHFKKCGVREKDIRKFAGSFERAQSWRKSPGLGKAQRKRGSLAQE